MIYLVTIMLFTIVEVLNGYIRFDNHSEYYMFLFFPFLVALGEHWINYVYLTIYFLFMMFQAKVVYDLTTNREKIMNTKLGQLYVKRSMFPVDFIKIQNNELDTLVDLFNKTDDLTIYYGGINKKNKNLHGGYINKSMFLKEQEDFKTLVNVFIHEYSHHLVRTYPKQEELKYFGKHPTLFEERATDTLAYQLAKSKHLVFDRFTYVKSKDKAERLMKDNPELVSDIIKLIKYEFDKE